MGNLIPFKQTFISGVSTRAVSARKLYEFLEVKRDFSNWIKARINQYNFEENQDFILIRKNGRIKKQGGDRKSVDYYLTIDMAKELAMVERNEKGKQARRYFIDCEKKLLESKKDKALPEKVTFGQRFIMRICGDETETSPIPEGAVVLTPAQIKNNLHEILPGYQLIDTPRFLLFTAFEKNIIEQQKPVKS